MNRLRRSRRILWAQLVILALCFCALLELALRFPYPSPLIKPLLPPRLRWPQEEITSWVEEGQFDRDFARYFARDPDRTIPAKATLVSPADGIVQDVVHDAKTTFLVIGLSFWDVHVVRTPVPATVKSVALEGSYLERMAPPDRLREMHFLRGKAAPVEAVITLAGPHGDVQVRMITSYWASRLKTWVYPGQKLAKGDRLGRIMLGSTVVTEFPRDVALEVKPGQRVWGGATTLSEH